MSNQPHSTPPGSPASSTRSTQSTATFRSIASHFRNNYGFGGIGKQAKDAVEPSSATKNRSTSHGTAATLVEGNLLAAHHINGDTGDDTDNRPPSSQRARKRDKIISLFWSSSPEPKIKQSQTPSPEASVDQRSTTSTVTTLHRSISTASTKVNFDIEDEVSSTEIKTRECKPSHQYYQPKITWTSFCTTSTNLPCSLLCPPNSAPTLTKPIVPAHTTCTRT